jgi:hypothetical protein
VQGILGPTSLPLEEVIDDLLQRPVGSVWPWHSLHPEDPPDHLVLEGRHFQVSELYCPHITCPCRLMYLRVQDCEPVDDLGCLHIDLDAGTLADVTDPRKERPLLETLWRQFRDRHQRFQDRARARSNEIRQIGALVLGGISNRLPEDVMEYLRSLGRNDPCFCGSGRKYKRCCQPIVTGLEPRPASPQ